MEKEEALLRFTDRSLRWITISEKSTYVKMMVLDLICERRHAIVVAIHAGVVKLVYTPALGAGAFGRRGSSPLTGTPYLSMKDLLFAAQLNQDIPTIDLHGVGDVQSALEQLEMKLFSFYNEGQQYGRVIHGIGTGALAKAVHGVLDKNPMIRQWREEETGGSCIILF